MSRVLIIGGHGKIALLAAPLLLEAGHQVRSVIRNPDHAGDVAATGATPVVADVEALNVPQLAALLDGAEVVVWSAGAGGGSPERTYAVDRDAAVRSMDAAVAAGVQRYLMVSYFGAGRAHGVDPGNSFYAYAEAKAAADEHLVASDLDWTILAPSRLTDYPGTGSIRTREQGATGDSVNRADVAAVIAAAIDEPGTIGRTIAFDNGDSPTADALR